VRETASPAPPGGDSGLGPGGSMAQAIDTPGPSRLKREWRDWLLFVALAGPNLLMFAIFNYRPLLYNAYLSFYEWDFLSPVKIPVGFDNYVDVLTDAHFHRVVQNTLVLMGGGVCLTIVIGLGLALLLNQKLAGRDAARSVLFAPYMLSGAAIAVVWVYIFDPTYGLLRTILSPFDIVPPNWLRDSAWAMPAVIIVYTWKNLGYTMVICLAGLQAIPRELYEAATTDGANALQRFRHVTIPGLAPITFFLLVTGILASFQTFDLIHVLTRGGPVDATYTLIYYLYEQGFVGFRAGRAGVASVIQFVFLFVITLVQIRYLERRVTYAG
jgi:multiple sugar transport system permease protein/sn-glycerol 3-phosphate transport system permease protein